MKRPLFVAGMCFLPALWLAFFFWWKEALLLSVVLALAGFAVARLGAYRLAPLCMALFSAATAFGVYAGYTLTNVAPLEALEGKAPLMEGILLEEDHYPNASYYTLKATFPEEKGLPRSVNVRLISRAPLEYEAGETIACAPVLQLTSSLKKAVRQQAKGVYLQGFVSPEMVWPAPNHFAGTMFFWQLRQRLSANLTQNLSHQSGQVASAMVLGTKGQLEPALANGFNRAGTSHLLTVSGLHFSILVAALERLLAKTRLSQRVRLLLCLGGAVFYMALAGFNPGVLRAGCMTLLVLCGRLASRQADSLNSWGAACVVLGVVAPQWVRSYSLWLSVLSTLGILLLQRPIADWLLHRMPAAGGWRRKLMRGAAQSLAVSLAACVFTLPVLLQMTGAVSLMSPIANLLVTPFVGIAMLGGVVCAFLPASWALAGLLAVVVELCTRLITLVSRLAATLTFAELSLDEWWGFVWLAGVMLLGFVVWRKGGSKRLVLLAACLSVILYCGGTLSQVVAKQGKVEVVALEGINPTLLLREKQAVVLGTPSSYEIQTLLEYLRFRGVQEVDAVVAWDSREQASGGMVRLAGELPVRVVLGPDDPYVLGQLARVSKSSVYSGKDARLVVLGGVEICPLETENQIQIRIGGTKLLKKREDYAILKDTKEAPEAAVALYNKGQAVVFRGGVAYEPQRRPFYGETRLLFSIQNAPAGEVQ